jgi:hypothetical protein
MIADKLFEHLAMIGGKALEHDAAALVSPGMFSESLPSFIPVRFCGNSVAQLMGFSSLAPPRPKPAG